VKKPLLLAALAALVLLSVFMLKNQDGPKQTAPAQSYLEDVKVVNKRTGHQQWTLLTRRAVISDRGDTARIEDVTVRLPAEGMVVQAESGVYGMDSRELTLSGEIRALADGYVIRTGSIRLDAEKGLITTDDEVVLEGDGFRIEGRGLRAEQDRKVRLEKDVKAVFF
jgi:LPS export ABC transporter protein LptC